MVEASNIDTKPKAEDLEYIFKNSTDIKERNTHIARAYKQGYSQHMIAKVLELNQATVQRIALASPDPLSLTVRIINKSFISILFVKIIMWYEEVETKERIFAEVG